MVVENDDDAIEGADAASFPPEVGTTQGRAKGEVVLMFSKKVGVKESNENEVMAILEALQLFSHSFQTLLIVENDSANAVKWASNIISRPWRFQFLFNKIKELSSHLDASF